MADAVVVFAGWNSSTQAWGAGTWGNDVAFSASATGAVGSVTISGASSVPSITGVAGTGQVGSASTVVGAGVNVSVTGIAATGGVGSTTVQGNSSFTVTGIASTGGIGQVTAVTDQTIPVVPSGLSSTALVNAATIVCECDANVSVTGVSAIGGTSSVLLWSKIIPTENTIWTEIAA